MSSAVESGSDVAAVDTGEAQFDSMDGALFVEMMTNGSPFTRYTHHGNSNTVTIDRVTISYQSIGGDDPLGCLTLVSSSTSSTSSLSLSSLTDVFVGQHTKTFSFPPAASASAELSFSLVTASDQWDLEADDEDTLSGWLVGIHYILTQTGRTTCLMEEEQKVQNQTSSTAPNNAADMAAKQRRSLTHRRSRSSFTIIDNTTEISSGTITSTSTTSAANNQEPAAAPSHRASIALPHSTALSILTTGAIFDRYYPSDGHIERIRLWFNPQSSRLGCFYYSTSNNHHTTQIDNNARVKEEKVSQSLPLHSLSDVVVGMKSLASNHSSISNNPTSCFSLLSRKDTASLHLIVINSSGERVVKEWVKSIKSVLNAVGATVVSSKKDPTPVAPTAADNSKENNNNNIQQSAADNNKTTMKPDSISKTTTDQSNANVAEEKKVEATIAMLSQPSAMSLISTSSSSSLYSLSAITVQLAYVDETYVLQYTHTPATASKKNKKITVKKITDMYIGASSPILQTISASSAAAAASLSASAPCIFSIITKKQSWDLLVDSEKTRNKYVGALKDVIVYTTKKKMVEELPIPAVGPPTSTPAASVSTPTVNTSASNAQTTAANNKVNATPAQAISHSRRLSFVPIAPLPATTSSNSTSASATPSATSATSTSSAADDEGSAALATLTAGLSFTSYTTIDGLTFKQPIILFYRQRRSQQVEQDLLYWCDDTINVNRNHPTLSLKHSMNIEYITDIFLGKQTEILQSKTAAMADDECCISLLSSPPNTTKTQLNLEAKDKKNVEALLAAIQYVCRDGGRDVNAEEDTHSVNTTPSSSTTTSTTPAPTPIPSAPALPSSKPVATEERVKQQQLAMLMKKSKRFSLGPVQQAAAKNRRISTLPSRASMLATQHDEVILPSSLSLQILQSAELMHNFYQSYLTSKDSSKITNAIIQMMTEGRVFTGYIQDSRGQYHSSPLLLFYDNSSHTFFWCPVAGQKRQHPNTSLALSSLTHIFIGKHTAALASVSASHGQAEHCFTLCDTYTHRAIDIEAKDIKVMMGYVFGIWLLLKKIGKTMENDDSIAHDNSKGKMRIVARSTTPPPPPPPATSATNNNTTVTTIPISSTISPSATTTTASAVVSRAVAATNSTTAAKATSILKTGHSFTIVVNVNNHILLQPQLVFLRGESLVCCASPSSQQAFSILNITDLYCGKMTSLMQSAAVAHIQEDRCLSIVCDQSHELNMICDDHTQVMHVVNEMMAILQQKGKTVTDDANTNNMVPPPPPLPSRPNPQKMQQMKQTQQQHTNPQHRQRRISILPSAAPTPASSSSSSSASSFPTTTNQLLNDAANRRRTLISVNPTKAIEQMKAGRVFRLYTMEQGGRIDSQIITIYYQSSKHILYWIKGTSMLSSSTNSKKDDNKHKIDPTHTFPLDILTEVILGKQTPIFLSSYTANIDRKTCITLLSTNNYLNLHLECMNDSHGLTMWLYGLQAVLQQHGKNVIVEQKQTVSSSSSSSSHGSDRRFSVVRRKNKENQPTNIIANTINKVMVPVLGGMLLTGSPKKNTGSVAMIAQD